MPRSRLLLSICATALVACSLVVSSEPAAAGGSARLAVVQILRHAAVATAQAARTGVHVTGSASLSETLTIDTASESTKAGAGFRGDISDTPQPQAKIKGYFHENAQFRRFILKASGDVAAAKLGHRKWACEPVSTATPPTSTTVPLHLTSGLMKWLHSLARKVQYSVISQVASDGTPVWDVSISLHTRLNLRALLLVASSSTVMGSGRHSVERRDLNRLLKLPHPWLNVSLNVWVDQMNYLIQQGTFAFKFREKQATLQANVGVALSRYGESVAVQLPGPCMPA